MQMLHRYRESLVGDRTALANRVRGYLREFGLFIPVGLSQVRKQVPLFLEDGENELTFEIRVIISRCYEKLLDLDKEIEQYTRKIEDFCKENTICQRLMKLSSVGPMIASIVYATVGDPNHLIICLYQKFKNHRKFQ